MIPVTYSIKVMAVLKYWQACQSVEEKISIE